MHACRLAGCARLLLLRAACGTAGSSTARRGGCGRLTRSQAWHTCQHGIERLHEGCHVQADRRGVAHLQREALRGRET